MWIDSLPETARVDDALMARAYEATGDEGRAWLKTTLALTRTLHGEAPEARTEYLRPAGAGFDIVRHECPADWVLVVVGQHFGAATRLAAALMTARLAGISRIVVLFSGAAEQAAPPVLTALELMGVEDIFCADADLLRSVSKAIQHDPAGRMLSFGHTPGNSLPEPFSPRIWCDTPPRALVGPDVEHDTALLSLIRRTHPDMIFLQQLSSNTNTSMTDIERLDSPADVSYTSCMPEVFCTPAEPKEPKEPAVPLLILPPELAGAWACSALTPAFFALTSLVTRFSPQFPNRS